MTPEETLKAALVAYQSRTTLPTFTDELHFYRIDDVFIAPNQPMYSYWCDKLRADRFQASEERGILYRPEITDQIIQDIESCFKTKGRRGLMIKGPQGIGKSHSLVNVYRKLVTSRKDYLVTFFPYCKEWKNEFFFLETVLNSLGIRSSDLGMQPRFGATNTNMTKEILNPLVQMIGDFLKNQNMKWVFIFDQINALFAKARDANKLNQLPEPFDLVDSVLRAGVVTSVIAASANNEISYKERHDDFVEHPHNYFLSDDEFEVFVEKYRPAASPPGAPNVLPPTQPAAAGGVQAPVQAVSVPATLPSKSMTSLSAQSPVAGAVLQVAPVVPVPGALAGKSTDSKMSGSIPAAKSCSDLAAREMDEATKKEKEKEDRKYYCNLWEQAGGVPMYTLRYMENPVMFQQGVRSEVEHSFDYLKKGSDWSMVLESLLCSLLETYTSSTRYDKKYFLQQPDEAGMNYKYSALFPAIKIACRSILWDNLMQYVSDQETNLLSVCKAPTTGNGTRGCIFESIAIQRMRSASSVVSLGDAVELTFAAGVEKLDGNEFPVLEPDGTSKTIVPVNPNFPALDWIWVSNRSIYAVQVHVTNHDDVWEDFIALARNAKWFDAFDEVHLLWFSPEDATTNLVEKWVNPESISVSLGRKTRNTTQVKTKTVKRKAISISSVSSIRNLAWPAGCSLPKKARKDENV